MRLRLSTVLFGAALPLPLVVPGCEEGDAPTYPQACVVADPAPHGVTLLGCGDDADCVTGTACLPALDCEDWPVAASGGTVLEDCWGSPGENVCRIPETRSGSRQALTRGFRVSAFHLSRARDELGAEKPAYVWDTPQDAEIVQCALFGCRPAVRLVEEERGYRRYTIANYRSCALAGEVFEPGSGVFDLTNREIEFVPDTDVPAGTATSERRISELMVGCWAFDTSTVIAATPLYLVEPFGMFNYQEAFDLECTSGEARACFLAATQRLGVCDAGTCRELCVDNSDCRLPDIVAEASPAATGTSEGQDGEGGVGNVCGETMDAPTAGASGQPGESVPMCRKTEHFIGVCVDGGAT